MVFNPEEHRRMIMEEVVYHSDDMYDACIYCDRHDSDDMWVACEVCNRWVHRLCTGLKVNNWDETVYKCELCEHYFN